MDARTRRAQALSLFAAAAVVVLGAGCGGGGGTEIKRVTVGQDPTDVVAAYGGVWVVNGDAVGKVDPETNELALNKFIPTDEGAQGIAAGGNCDLGRLRDRPGRRRDRSEHALGRRQDQGREPADCGRLRRGRSMGQRGGCRSGAADRPREAQGARAPDPGRVRARRPRRGRGAVWVANQFEYTVSRIDPATNKVVATIKVGIQPTDVAIGEGAMWV